MERKIIDLPIDQNSNIVLYCFYYDMKMFLTLDINWMIELIISNFGSNINIHFIEMNERQKEESSHKETNFDIVIVDEIIKVYVFNRKNSN
ncbi:hypothetical protein HUN36_18950, partial [Acinetobacter bereziniae]